MDIIYAGNYLLLWDEPVWKELQPLFHTTWFIDCPEEVLRERVIERNSAAWGWSRTQTAIKVDANDMLNARLVCVCVCVAVAVLCCGCGCVDVQNTHTHIHTHTHTHTHNPQ